VATRNARVILSAEDRASAEINRVERALRGGLGGAIGYVSSALTPMGVGLGAATAALGVFAAAAAATVAMLGQVVHAAAEQQEADIRLAAALRSVGEDADAAVPRLRDYASRLQATTAYSDDAIQSGMALLVSIGRLRGEGLERATKAALDLAAGTQQELEPAFRALAKAAAGNTTALQKLIGEIGKGATEGETFARALDRIDTNFSGQAAARMDSFRGQVEALGLAWGDVQEIIGQPFLEVLQTDAQALLPLLLGFADAEAAAQAYRMAVLQAAAATHAAVAAAATLGAGMLDLAGDAEQAILALHPLIATAARLSGTDIGEFLDDAAEGLDAISERAAEAARRLAALSLAEPSLGTARATPGGSDEDREEEAAAAARKRRAETVHRDLLQQQQTFARAALATQEALAAALAGQEEAQWQQRRVAMTQRQALELHDLERSLDEQTRARRDSGARLTAEEQAAVEANAEAAGELRRKHQAEIEADDAAHQERLRQQAARAAQTRAETELLIATEALARRQAAEETAMQERHAAERLAVAGQAEALREVEARQAQETQALRVQHATELQAELLPIELAGLRERHAAELAEIGRSEEEKAALRAQFRADEEALRDEYLARVTEANAAAAERDAAIDEAAAEHKREQVRRAGDMIVGSLREIFGKSKTASIALALIDTFRAAARAYADFPWPFSAVVAGLVTAAGLKQVADIRKQRFATGGVVQGPGGSDRVPSLLTAGELVADTRPAEARAILGGRAAIVPMALLRDAASSAAGSAQRSTRGGRVDEMPPVGGGPGRDIAIHLHVAGDVLDSEEWFLRNASGVARAIREASDRGML